VLHRAAYEVLGLSWDYLAQEVDEQSLAEQWLARSPDLVGLSLTMPLKEAIVPLIEQRTPVVELLGVANTVTFRKRQPALANTVNGTVVDNSGTRPLQGAEVRIDALGRVTPDKRVRLVRGDREAFGLHGRSAEQRIALDLLLDPDVGIVSLGGRAGTGKSALALCAGLEAVLERRQHRKVVVFRPLYAVGGQDLGYLPGTENEKMSPWAQAVFDTLGAVTTGEVVEEILDRGMLEVLPLTHIRGRSLHDAFVIVDEAQSLERNVLLTVLSRIGADSRVVLTHDVAQRDNLRVGRHDGVVAVAEKLKGHPLFAHITLTRSERSPIAALVTEMLEELPV